MQSETIRTMKKFDDLQPQLVQHVTDINSIMALSTKTGGVKNLVENQGEVDLNQCTRCLIFKKSSGEDRDGA